MAASGEHVKALVRSHAAGDDAAFYSVALQVAAQAARRGHNQLAGELKRTIESSRSEPVARKVTAIARPRGDLKDLVTATYPDAGIEDLVGPLELIGQIRQVLAEQRQRRNVLAHGYAPVHRLLLDGPPGTGKTFTASVLAHELSLPLLTIRLDALVSRYLGETAGKLRTVFDAVIEQRAVYLFDEFDALGGDRSGNDVGEARRILNSFLVFLEEATSESLVVAATNHRDILDKALFRRFDMLITYQLPNDTQATNVLRRRLGSMGKEIDWSALNLGGQNLSHAELVKAAEAAAKAALMNGQALVGQQLLADAIRARRAVNSD
jgi:SpoVK/Ycf46/Vps4 family AAA+-type ATPase